MMTTTSSTVRLVSHLEMFEMVLATKFGSVELLLDHVSVQTHLISLFKR